MGSILSETVIAQARVEELPVLTSDDRFSAYGIDVLW
jgi:PIN domain nuclease of toxin-antitoxin system